jgi:hypothetical protein
VWTCRERSAGTAAGESRLPGHPGRSGRDWRAEQQLAYSGTSLPGVASCGRIPRADVRCACPLAKAHSTSGRFSGANRQDAEVRVLRAPPWECWRCWHAGDHLHSCSTRSRPVGARGSWKDHQCVRLRVDGALSRQSAGMGPGFRTVCAGLTTEAVNTLPMGRRPRRHLTAEASESNWAGMVCRAAGHWAENRRDVRWLRGSGHVVGLRLHWRTLSACVGQGRMLE